MRLVDKYKPTRLTDVVGNAKALSRIDKAVDQNDGFGGLVLMLTGKTGNGKTLIADLIANAIGGDLYRPNCAAESEMNTSIENLKRHIAVRSLYAPQSVYILDEADRLAVDNIARLKVAIDMIDRRRQEGRECNVTVIFTTAQNTKYLTEKQKKHWDEFASRCIQCEIDVLASEMDKYFSDLTGGTVTDISKRIKVQSMRAAWEWIDANDIDVVE